MNRQRVIQITQWICRLVLGAILILAGYLKLQDNSQLLETVAYITWIPVGIRWFIVDYLPWVEILLGLLLIIRLREIWVKPVVTFIYAGFLAFAIYGFATGMEGDCGCFGEFAESSFGWKMIFRNALFVGMAGFLFYDPDNSYILKQQTPEP